MSGQCKKLNIIYCNWTWLHVIHSLSKWRNLILWIGSFRQFDFASNNWFNKSLTIIKCHNVYNITIHYHTFKAPKMVLNVDALMFEAHTVNALLFSNFSFYIYNKKTLKFEFHPLIGVLVSHMSLSTVIWTKRFPQFSKWDAKPGFTGSYMPANSYLGAIDMHEQK